MIRNSFSTLGRWIDSQSTLGRVATLVGAVVLFGIGQQIAGLSNAAENGSAAVEALTGIVAIVFAIVALYAVYAVVRAFLGRGPTTDTADAADGSNTAGE